MTTAPHRVLRCLFLAGAFCFLCFAASAVSTNTQWSISSWKSDDGLPNDHVTGLAQTPDGYLWIATFSRPARFDGVRFDDYFLRDYSVPANQKITALQLGRDGLWMGTSHGEIISLNRNGVRIFTNTMPDKVTQALVEDGEGALWATFQGGQVRRIKDGKVASFGSEEGLSATDIPGRYVCSFACDEHGQLWFAKDGQAGVFRGGHFETLLQLPPVTRLAAAKGGGVWICSGHQLAKFKEGGKLEIRGDFTTQPADADPSVILEDQMGGVWIGTSGGGLIHFNGATFESIPISDSRITCLTEDREGNMWVGTESGGLNRIRPSIVTLETAKTGLPLGTVQSLCQDSHGTVWATIQNGQVARREGGGWHVVSRDPDGLPGQATCVTMDASGAVWIGTKDHRLHCWRDGHFTTLDASDGLLGRQLHALLADRKGDLWIGEESPDLVQRLHAGKFETFQVPAGVRIIRAMAEDSSGAIWVGSSGGKLLRIRDGVVDDETSATSGQPLSIRCLHATPDGSLWIGYADEGLGLLRDGHFTHLGFARGFPEENLSQIIADGQGWLWFAGDHGIFAARQQNLEELAHGGAGGLNYIRLGRSEGLFSLEANTGDSPGAMRDSSGLIWLPMRNALAIVNPDRRAGQNSDPPPVVLKRVTVDDRTVASYGGVMPVLYGLDLLGATGELRLAPGYHRLDFQFTALSFDAPENVRFRYRLEGFDDGWVDCGTQRSASYSRLAAGSYRFRVKACNSRGIWNEHGATLQLVVAPFMWQTWWFRLVVLALFTSLVVATVRYLSFRRLRLKLRALEQQAALDRERARIARDIHDDLGGRLTEVELLLQKAQRTAPEKLNGQMGQISDTIRHVGESLDEIVWAVNPRHDTLPHLMDYLGQYAIQFFQNAGVRCRVDFPVEFPQRAMPPEVRHNLFLTAKEALHNVVKHAQATEIWLRASLGGDSLTLVIEDNGKGFNAPPEKLDADGLLNMRRRMEELGGKFCIEARPDGGTRVVLTLALPPATAPTATPVK